MKRKKVEECPKELCFHWIPPEGKAEVSGQRFKNINEAFEKGEWKSFPVGGCSCSKRCNRIYEDSETDYFESA